jgi:hypothetical protein
MWSKNTHAVDLKEKICKPHARCKSVPHVRILYICTLYLLFRRKYSTAAKSLFKKICWYRLQYLQLQDVLFSYIAKPCLLHYWRRQSIPMCASPIHAIFNLLSSLFRHFTL